MKDIKIPRTYEELLAAAASKPAQLTKPELYYLCEAELKERGYKFIDYGCWEKCDDPAYMLEVGWNSSCGAPVYVELQDAEHCILNLGYIGIYDITSFKTFLNIVEKINGDMASSGDE
jgi:hypothetical protein